MAKLSFIDRFHHWRRKTRWNMQYKKGKWDYLNNEREAARYNKIIEYIKIYSNAKPKVLDLGSGEAILNEKIDPESYTQFYNVDFSSASIKKAQEKKLRNSKNIVADIHSYSPESNFDVIVFNEAFYYVHRDLKNEVLNRFISKIKEDGVLITSIYKEGQDCWDMIDASKKLEKLNFETVTSDRKETYWKVGVYRKL